MFRRNDEFSESVRARSIIYVVIFLVLVIFPVSIIIASFLFSNSVRYSLEENSGISTCVLVPNRKYLGRPHGINNQILLFSTMFMDLESLLENGCKIYFKDVRMFNSHYGLTQLYLPFERVFEIPSANSMFLTKSEYEEITSKKQGLKKIKTTYNELRTTSFEKVVSDQLEDEEEIKTIIIDFDTSGIYDDSIWRWFAIGFFLRDLRMIRFVQNNIFLQEFFLNIFHKALETNNHDLSISELQHETLVVHLRFAPHCISTGAEGAFGEWFEAFYTCNPSFNQFKDNIDEVIYRESQVSRIIFLTINETHPITIGLLEEFEKRGYDPVVGSSFFTDKSIRDMELPQYVNDLVEYLFLELSNTHLSTFISTYSLVGAMKRGFRRSYFVRPFGYTFGRFGGFLFLRNVFGIVCVLVMVWKLFRFLRRSSGRRRKEGMFLLLLLDKKVGRMMIKGILCSFVVMYVGPLVLEILVAVGVGVTMFEFGRLGRLVLSIFGL